MTTTPTIEDLRQEAFSTPATHCGELSNGASVLIDRLLLDSVPADRRHITYARLISSAQRCIGAGCAPRVRPLPGQNDLGSSLAAPAEADQVEGTRKVACHDLCECRYCICKPESLECLNQDTPTLKQFQRWLETVAHIASRNIVSGAFNAAIVSECRIATKLLMQFKHGTGK